MKEHDNGRVLARNLSESVPSDDECSCEGESHTASSWVVAGHLAEVGEIPHYRRQWGQSELT